MLYMRKMVWLLALAVGVGLVAGCGDDGESPTGTTPVDQFEVVRAAVDTYLSSGDGPTLSAQDLYDTMTDTDTTNDYFVVSVRSAAHYAIGHIPGAINIPWQDTADATLLAGLPTDQKIAVYCYTGHTGAVATTTLRALGYEAYNVKFGIMSWTRDTAVRVASAFDDTADAHDYSTEP